MSIGRHYICIRISQLIASDKDISYIGTAIVDLVSREIIPIAIVKLVIMGLNCCRHYG